MTSTSRPVGKGDHIFLVDGSSFIFRAYFQSMNQDRKYNYRSDGLPTGAIRLFATKLMQFVKEGADGVVPTHLAIIFDKSENSFRKELYPPYKSNRSDPPEDLIPQFPLMREAVRAFGLFPVEQDRYEADDLIATYARIAVERGADVTIISADKDLMQLIKPGVSMYDPASGDAKSKTYRPERRIGREEVVAYFGVEPEKVVDVQALAGDFDRQRAGRARHRRQDRGAAPERIRRPRNLAGARRRDQAAEAPRGLARERRARAHLEKARDACGRCRARDPARRSRLAPARRPCRSWPFSRPWNSPRSRGAWPSFTASTRTRSSRMRG